jgi:flagellar biosynthesis protein FlhF
MNVKRFVGATARDCLRQVKEALGPDAIVVSNRAVAGGVEIMAMSADGLEALARHSAPGTGPSAPPAGRVAVHAGATNADDDYTVSLSAQVRKQPAYQPWQPALRPTQSAAKAAAAGETARPRPLPPKGSATAEVPSQHQVASVLRSAIDDQSSGFAAQSVQQLDQLRLEMQSIKALLEQQLAGFAWGEMARDTPARAMLLGEMLDAGFSGQLARRLVADIAAEVAPEEGRKWLRAAVSRRLRTVSNEDDLIERGGVYALVGPTGVGKTTTTAKLAARCVVRHGADKLALLTTDGYRIGAHEQLRIYGRILGVPVHVVRDGEDLRHTLADLRDKHMILIDTVGMSQRDRMVTEQAAMLTRAGAVSRLLLLNATCRGDTLDDVVRAYAGEDLAGCILTKVDETASLAPAIDAVVRHGLLLAYIANGQRVPEDMHLPNRSYLLHRAFKLPLQASPHRLVGAEAGLAMTTHGTTAPRLSGAAFA